MYPAGELNLLAVRKALVRVRIAEHRWQCVHAAAELARPVDWVDRRIAQWRRLSPLLRMAGLPVIMLLVKKLKLFSRFQEVAALARSLPLVITTARAVAGFAKNGRGNGRTEL